MFLSELQPLLEESLRQPIAFLGGLTSGLLRIDLDHDPVKSWLNEQLGHRSSPPTPPADNRPQTIEID